VVFRSFIFGGPAWFTVPTATGAVALLALAQDFDSPQVKWSSSSSPPSSSAVGGGDGVYSQLLHLSPPRWIPLLASTADLLAEEVYVTMLNP